MWLCRTNGRQWQEKLGNSSIPLLENGISTNNEWQYVEFCTVCLSFLDRVVRIDLFLDSVCDIFNQQLFSLVSAKVPFPPTKVEFKMRTWVGVYQYGMIRPDEFSWTDTPFERGITSFVIPLFSLNLASTLPSKKKILLKFLTQPLKYFTSDDPTLYFNEPHTYSRILRKKDLKKHGPSEDLEHWVWRTPRMLCPWWYRQAQNFLPGPWSSPDWISSENTPKVSIFAWFARHFVGCQIRYL